MFRVAAVCVSHLVNVSVKAISFFSSNIRRLLMSALELGNEVMLFRSSLINPLVMVILQCNLILYYNLFLYKII